MKKEVGYVEACGGIRIPNNDTELVFIIDRSGSMEGFEADTVGGFNSMIEKQRSGDGMVYVSTVLFDSESEVVHDRVPIGEVVRMTEEDYAVGGCTALLDALGDAIRHIGNIHRYARPDDVPAHTVFVITTDGMENASHRYSSKRIKDMIKRKKRDHGWEFIFVAANIDAVETAGSIGIERDRAANYVQTSDGFTECYAAMSNFVSMRRARGVVDSSWKKRLEEKGE